MNMIDIRPEKRALRAEILEGLGKAQKSLPPKLLYDDAGSQLFERICTTREYYITRLEISLLKEHSREIADSLGDRAVLLELGSGSSTKTRVLLGSLHSPAAYVPIDVSEKLLVDSSREIASEYPNLNLVPICADFSQSPLTALASHPVIREFREVRLDAPPGSGALVGFMPGSTLGNFEPGDAAQFLASMGVALGPLGYILIGIDLVKDASIMHAAYNDVDGVTAAFNLNILRRLNREFNANFDLRQFAHFARFRFWESRIEMHLESQIEQTVIVAGQAFHFDRGETIHTENSYKYTRQSFADLAGSAGCDVRACWTDPHGFFAVYLLRVTGAFQAESPCYLEA